MIKTKCPICRQPISKRKLRELSEKEFQKMQTAYWMQAWNREFQRNQELERQLREGRKPKQTAA